MNKKILILLTAGLLVGCTSTNKSNTSKIEETNIENNTKA